jgi:hypothetical protein
MIYCLDSVSPDDDVNRDSCLWAAMHPESVPCSSQTRCVDRNHLAALSLMVERRERTAGRDY